MKRLKVISVVAAQRLHVAYVGMLCLGVWHADYRQVPAAGFWQCLFAVVVLGAVVGSSPALQGYVERLESR